MLPEDMLREEAEAVDRPRAVAVLQPASALAADKLLLVGLLRSAIAPVAIIGGGGWNAAAARHFAAFAERTGIPVATAFRRQDAIASDSPVYAGNLGYGPNPKLAQRIRNADLLLVVGARLGEATTDGYELITPDHPDQILIHVHPDPNELGSVYRTDLPICAQPTPFAEVMASKTDKGVNFTSGAEAHREWLDWSTPKPRDTALDLGQAMLALRKRLPADTIVCNGAGNYSGWVHRYWRYGPFPSQLAPTAGTMGYGLPAAIAAALRCPDRTVLAVVGDGEFQMTGQELATAVQYGAQMILILADNGSYGTIRMHQERDYPQRTIGTDLVNPDFAALAGSYGIWSRRVEKTEDFDEALQEAMGQNGVRLLHVRTDVETITHSATLSGLRDS
jgi:acetolactate synthase-1/2/3 large subunit